MICDHIFSKIAAAPSLDWPFQSREGFQVSEFHGFRLRRAIVFTIFACGAWNSLGNDPTAHVFL